MFKLDQKVEVNQKKLEKIDIDGMVRQLVSNKEFDDDKVYLVEKNKEFGGCLPKKVIFLSVCKSYWLKIISIN